MHTILFFKCTYLYQVTWSDCIRNRWSEIVVCVNNRFKVLRMYLRRTLIKKIRHFTKIKWNPQCHARNSLSCRACSLAADRGARALARLRGALPIACYYRRSTATTKTSACATASNSLQASLTSTTITHDRRRGERYPADCAAETLAAKYST